MELLLKVLREANEPVEIASFGSCRAIAVAYNRQPELLRKRVKRIHVCAGASELGYLEWNVVLDPQALVRLLRSDLPIAIYPCATKEGPFAYGPHNCFWKLNNLQFIEKSAAVAGLSGFRLQPIKPHGFSSGHGRGPAGRVAQRDRQA